MRTAALLASLVVISTPAWAGHAPDVATHATPPAGNKFLDPELVTAQVRPQRQQIEQCYLDVAADAHGAGRLEVTLVIARDGYVLKATTATPGLPAKTAKKIETCVKAIVEPIKFPTRRNDTTAVVPYIFQRTESPDSGPQLSCWDPKGCH